MSISLPLLTSPSSTAPPHAHFDTGPRSIAAVQMLRISLTDRCNFRCLYCMPEDGVPFLPTADLLSADDILTIATAALQYHGIARFKLTGGEPTLRPDLLTIVRRLAALPGLQDLSLTTNGMLLQKLAAPLKDAGLHRLTISLDSLNPARFQQITRTGDLPTVLAGLDAAERAHFPYTKINCVMMRGTNDDELPTFAALTLTRNLTVRFIEYMPLGDAALLHTDLTEIPDNLLGPAHGCSSQLRGPDAFFPESEARALIEKTHGPLTPLPRDDNAGVGPAKLFQLPHAAGKIGFISAMSAPFCSTCNRLRLTAQGLLRSCLFDAGEIDLRPLLQKYIAPGSPGVPYIAPGSPGVPYIAPGLPGVALEERAQSSLHQQLAQAMTDCVRLKPDTHSNHGNQQMSRLGG